MNQEPEQFEPMMEEPSDVNDNEWNLEKNPSTEVEIPYVEENSSGSLKKKLAGFGAAVVLVAGLCVFLFFFFRPTGIEYILSAMNRTLTETGKVFQAAEAGNIFDTSMENGKYMLELKTSDEYLNQLGFYVDAGKKQLLLDVQGDGETFQFYLDDEEFSAGSPEEVVFLNFSEFKTKFPVCPLVKEGNSDISEEDMEKVDKVLTELRALIWETLSASPLENKEQKKSFADLKEKIVVEKKGKKELSSKNGTVSCTVYEVSIGMDDLTDFFCEILENSMAGNNEHMKNIISTISEEDVERQYEVSKERMLNGLREGMQEIKRDFGDKLFFDVYANSDDQLAGVSFEWKIKEETVNAEFLCPTGNIAEEAKLVLVNGNQKISISNEGKASGDIFQGSIREEENGTSEEILNYEYNLKSGEFRLVPKGSGEDVLCGKFYVNKEKKQVETAFYPEGEEFSILFGNMESDIQKPSGQRHNLLLETSESLSEVGIMKKYLVGGPAAGEDVESYGLDNYGYDGYKLEDDSLEDYGQDEDSDADVYDFEDYGQDEDSDADVYDFEDYGQDEDYDAEIYDFEDYDQNEENYDFEAYDAEDHEL